MSYTAQLSGSTFHSGELYNTTEWWYFHSCELNNIAEWWYFHSRELYNTTELTHELSDVSKYAYVIFEIVLSGDINSLQALNLKHFLVCLFIYIYVYIIKKTYFSSLLAGKTFNIISAIIAKVLSIKL